MDTHSSPFICSVYTLAFLMNCTTDDPIEVATASSQSDIADLFFALSHIVHMLSHLRGHLFSLSTRSVNASSTGRQIKEFCILLSYWTQVIKKEKVVWVR